MINYIKATCELPPLNRPQYDSESETYDIYFSEKVGENPYNLAQGMIRIPFETLEEANRTLQETLGLYYEEEVKENA